MVKINKGGKRGHQAKEAERRQKKLEKRQKRHNDNNGNDNNYAAIDDNVGDVGYNVASDRSDNDSHQKKAYAIGILFYGRKKWYDTVTEVLGLDENGVLYSDFLKDDIPEGIGSIDVLVVDCVNVDGKFPAKDLLELVQGDGIKVCLNYGSDTDITELMGLKDVMYPYNRLPDLKKYLERVEAEKLGS